MFTLTPDQELFTATNARFLQSCHPLGGARHHTDGTLTAAGSDSPSWQRGAELGWTSLLVPEDVGGGAIDGNGVVGLAALAMLFGAHAAPGPLTATNVVAAALGRWGSPSQQSGPLAELLDGRATASWCASVQVDPWAANRTPIVATTCGEAMILTGEVACAEAAADSTYLLVNAEHQQSESFYLVARDTPGISMSPLVSLDPARRYSRLSLAEVLVTSTARVGPPGAAELGSEWLIDIVATLQTAEIVGAMKSAVDMTISWVSDRYSFGRPLASYQEIKHRIADMRTTLQACAAICERAARALGRDADDASALASAAMSFVGESGPEVIQDCIQLHGGIGVTAEHPLHLLLRRAVVAANAFATPADFTQRLVGLVYIAD